MTQTLLITGASSGIGAAPARAAVKAGWQVALLARSRDALEKLAAELGDAALALPCDIPERDQLRDAVGKTVERFRGLDAVYANAGKGCLASAPISIPTPAAHFVPNSFGEYHSAHRPKQSTVLTTTAIRFTPATKTIIVIPLFYQY